MPSTDSVHNICQSFAVSLLPERFIGGSASKQPCFPNQLFSVLFIKECLVYGNFCIFAHDSDSPVGQEGQDIDGTETEKAVCRAGLERTFSKRYLLHQNFATFGQSLEDMRNEASMQGVLYPDGREPSLAPCALAYIIRNGVGWLSCLF